MKTLSYDTLKNPRLPSDCRGTVPTRILLTNKTYQKRTFLNVSRLINTAPKSRENSPRNKVQIHDRKNYHNIAVIY